MKKNYLLMFALLVNIMLVQAATLTGTCGPNLNWSLDTKAKTLTISGYGAMQFETAYEQPWKEYRQYISSVSLPEGLTTICDYAFEYCEELQSVNIPNTVTTIGVNAFYYCKALTVIQMGNSVTSIGGHAFSDCKNLASVTLNNNLKSIGESAFQYCENLLEIDLPDGLVSMGQSTFHYCKKLSSIIIPNSVTTIGQGAFYNCQALSSAVLSENISTIPINLFCACTNLTTITIPNSSTSIGSNAFSSCSNLVHVIIGSGVTTIEDNAFSGCYKLHKLTVLAPNPPANARNSELYHKTCALYVPAQSVSIYDDTYWWEEFASIRSLEEDNGYLSTCDYGAFFIAGGGYNPETQEQFAVPQWCNGQLWKFNSTRLDLVADNTFSQTFDLPAGTYEFKLTTYSNNEDEEWFGYDDYEMGEQTEIRECRKHIYFVMEESGGSINNNCRFFLREADQVKITYNCAEHTLRVERMHPSSVVYCDYTEYFIAGAGYADNDDNTPVSTWCDGLQWVHNGCLLQAKREGKFSKTFLLPAGDYEFKITAGDNMWFGTDDSDAPTCEYQVEFSIPKFSDNGPYNCEFITTEEDSVRVTYNCELRTVRVERLHIHDARTYVTRSLEMNVCKGETAIIHGKSHIINKDVVLQDTIISGTSLIDTICQTNIHVLPTYDKTISMTIAAGQTYNWEGHSITTSGLYTSDLKTMNDCDSIVTLSVTVVSDGWDPGHPENPGNYQLSLNVNDETMGRVTGAGLYPQNSSVEVTAVPTEGHYFVRWSDNVSDATRTIALSQDMELTAYFAVNEYKIIFANYDGAILQQTNEAYGTMPVYEGQTPERPATTQYSYTFIGWEPGIALVKEEATYVAQYEAVLVGVDSITVTGNEDIADLQVGPMTHIIVAKTGHLTISQPTVAATLTLIADSVCGQVSGLENLQVNNVDMVLNLKAASGSIASRWFAFAVPFEVSVASGIRIEGTAQNAVSGLDFVIDEYNGALRASTQDGWQRVAANATLLPGHLYMIAPASAAQWRITALNPNSLSEPDQVAVAAYTSSLGSHHSGWNGIANPMWREAYAQMAEIYYATLYNNYYGLYEVVPMSEYKPSAAMPFFVQAPADGYVEFGENASPNMAPMRMELSSSSNMAYTVELSEVKTSYTDKAYMTFSENKDNRYTIGRDLEKIQVAAPAAPQVWFEAYGLRLAAHEASADEYRATVQVGMYAPQDGTYLLKMSRLPDNATVYLTYQNHEIWNLSISPYTIELTQGDNTNYGISVLYSPMVETGITNTNSDDTAIMKLLKDNQVLILRGDRTYTVIGQVVENRHNF